MKSQLLKLEAPYNVIYAGGKVGRHIATLMVWNDDEEMAGGITDAACCTTAALSARIPRKRDAPPPTSSGWPR